MTSKRPMIVCFLAFVLLTQSLCAQELDSQTVRQAIERGVQHLQRRQQPDGKWDATGNDELCGTTSLVVLALVSSGVPKNDPTITRAMKFLRENPGKRAGRNYSLSLQTMAFCIVSPDQDKALIRENVRLLEENQVKGNSPNSGGWHYTSGGGGSDLSNSQFSILALYEAERVGVSAKKETWQRALDFWDRTQNEDDGSWGYTPQGKGSGPGTGSMTCAGLASLIVTSGVLGQGGATVRGENIACFQKPDARIAEKIDRGIAWLARNFSVSQNPRSGDWLFYYLYALERVGRMTNHRFIGNHDWYREGTERLLQIRDQLDGSWRDRTGQDVSTAFALLFLSKGRRPVLMSKVQFGGDDAWNVHPNDVNNLTGFAEKNWKLDLTWQVIPVDRATTDDLLQSPVLYLCGNRSPLPSNERTQAELVDKLRGYLDQGGFIIGEAQANDQGDFHDGFRELMQLVLPEPGYELQLLEQNHPIWMAEFSIEPEQMRPIEGINFGCRTSVVYVPKSMDGTRLRPSLSCLWEVAQIFDRGTKYSASVQRQIDAGLGIGLNILAYATNRELKFKEEVAEAVGKRLNAAEDRRGRIFLGLLEHGGGANAAPHAIPNLLQWSALHLGLPVDIRTDLIEPASPELLNYPIVFVHGRSAFQWTDDQRTQLRKYIENGGFLFGSAICSSKPFADSFKAEMKRMFSDRPLEAVTPDDPLWSEEYGGFRIRTLQLRLPEQAPGKKMVVSERTVVPELQGIRFGDRLAVVFSPHDVSCALEKANTLECKGYSQESAMQLTVNVLLYALEHQHTTRDR